MKKNRGTRVISIGHVKIGGSHPIAVQSMTNTETANVRSTLAQIRKLAKAGCEIIRVAVPDARSAAALPGIIKRSPLPVVADIHFDPGLALASLQAGVHGLRLNPGNIRNKKKVAEIIDAAAERKVPIRVGVNAGSIPKDLLRKHNGPTAKALVASAMEHINILEDRGFADIKVSLKSSHVPTTVEAYRIMRKKRDYPLHLGITESGTLFTGLVKSSAGLGILLSEGIGDTIRVSLAADPADEVRACYALLRSLGLRRRGVTLIACPTCARTMIDVMKTAAAIEKRLSNVAEPLRIAVMGCGVNGPGEARHSDLGVVGTSRGAKMYLKGRAAGTVEGKEIVPWLERHALEMAEEQRRPPAGKRAARKAALQ